MTWSFPARTGAHFNDHDWRKCGHRILDPVGLGRSRPYDLRHSLVSLLIHEGRTVVGWAKTQIAGSQ